MVISMNQPQPTPEERITSAMSRPKKMTLEGNTTEQHSLKEIQDAQERVAATQAMRRAPFGMRFAKVRFPGAT